MKCDQKLLLTCLCALMALLLVQCSGKGDSGVNDPAPKIVQMTGTLVLPAESGLTNSDLTVGFGDDDNQADSAGSFSIKGKEHIPGVVIAYNQSGSPVLLGVVADPQTNLNIPIDIHSTALGLAFLSPFVCAGSADATVSTLQQLETLPELMEMEDLLSLKLAYDPEALMYEDAELDDALSKVVNAYLNSYPEESAKLWQTAIDQPGQIVPKRTASGPEIYPSTTVSGLKLSWNGGNEFQITNAYGRWAYCCTSEDTFMLFPNGDLLDAIKLKRPWSPSVRKFTMQVEPGGDTAYVDVLGYGFWQSPANAWDSLSHSEQTFAHAGGITTVTMELVLNVISVITNTPRVYGNERVASLWGKTGWDIILKNSKYVQRANEYIRANDPWGLSWYLTKQIISEYVMSDSYREFIQYTLGLSITSNALERLSRWVAVPLKAVVDFNSITTVMKTAMALTTAHFSTSFKVWRDVEDFGSIQGHVGDKVSGNPIQGATVNVTGDDGNPLNPPHEKTTDAGGYFLFINIGAGERTVTVSKSGYKTSSIAVTVEKDKTVTADFPLERQAGGLSGRVLNEIFVRNGITPSEFKGTVDLTTRQVGGQGEPGNIHVYDGTYSLSLPAGSWWVIASFDNYHPDSFMVTVPSDGNITAPRDLVLRPAPTTTGTVSFDMNNDGNYEQEYTITFPQAGLTMPGSAPNGCSRGGQVMTTMDVMGIRGTTSTDYDALGLGLNTVRITQTGQYDLGGIEYYGCTGVNVSAAASFVTTRHYCTTTWGQSSPMPFSFQGHPDEAGCNCGITRPGDLYLEAWGTAIGDSVFGAYTVELAGSRTCQCSGSDTDGDGIIDQWTVACARVKLEIYFRLFVGTDYLITFQPSSVIPR